MAAGARRRGARRLDQGRDRDVRRARRFAGRLEALATGAGLALRQRAGVRPVIRIRDRLARRQAADAPAAGRETVELCSQGPPGGGIARIVMARAQLERVVEQVVELALPRAID